MPNIDKGYIALDALRAKGPQRVVLTMGEQGVLFSDNTSVTHVPAMKVDVVDTTVCESVCGQYYFSNLLGKKSWM